MNIGLIGSGGREHALCQKMHESKIVKKLILTTAITTILFAIIYLLNYFDILNIRKILT